MKIIWCVLWLVALTTTVKGYKSCDEIQESKNASGFYVIEFGDKELQVMCNLTAKPAITTLQYHDSVKIENPGSHSKSYSFHYLVQYNISLDILRTFIEHSESCRQHVTYNCKNATLFGNGMSAFSRWTSINDSPKYYWAGCSYSDHSCRCDQRKSGMDSGYLTKKKDLPVKSLHIGGLSSDSDVYIEIGKISCYGSSQKNSFTFSDRNSFVSLNVSSMKELKFKFKSSNADRNKIIASLRIPNEKDLLIGVDSESNLYAGLLKFTKLNEEWHSVMLKVEGKTVYAVVNNGVKKAIFEIEMSGTVGAKLVLGDYQRDCNTFSGCIKDLSVDGEDYTKIITGTNMKEFVMEGCKKASSIQCSDPKVLDKDTMSGIMTTSNSVGTIMNKTTPTSNKDGNVDSPGGNDDNAAIIAIVVVFLILLFILIIVFLITWYLKRNKGVYQTHEGSAEDIHGDTDNLTLVTKPQEQEAEGDKGKEYYL